MRVIYHIGAGKTGTTSIQRTFNQNRSTLEEAGILYLGLCFENYFPKKKWNKTPLMSYMSLSDEDIAPEFIEMLEASIKVAERKGCHTVVASNESYSTNLPKLKEYFYYVDNKYDLQICFYVRTPEKWAESAYIQWRIKHKKNKGRILDAGSYLESQPFRVFTKVIKYLQESNLNHCLDVRNMDACGDVVDDFCQFYDIPELGKIRMNESLDSFEKALFYLVNNAHDEPVLPHEGKAILSKLNNVEYDEYISKTEINEDLFDKEELLKEKQYINEFLDESSQLDYQFSLKNRTDEPLCSEKNMMRLMQYCLLLNSEVSRLEKIIEEKLADKNSLGNRLNSFWRNKN